ncbi:heparinase II/III family protein, partial [Acinetobacter baumannii]
QGGIEGDTRLADAVLSRAEAHGKPLAEAPYSGFERATARKALLLVDVGPPPDPATTGGRPHAGLLACEFSSGKDRLFVNCGETLRSDGVWAGALA